MKTMTSAFTMVVAAMLLLAPSLQGQRPGQDPSARLREVLPADVADRVLARIAEARARELPPEAVAALENRALKFASRGVAPADVERAVGEHATRMQTARGAIEAGRGARASGEEIDAGAEAMRQGVDGEAVSALAKSAPSGRSLAVPLFVIGSLVERGLPSDAALTQVRDRLAARASDADLQRMARDPQRGRPEGAGQGMRPTDRPGGTGRPANVPATGGRPAQPVSPGTRPVTPPAGPRRP